ncbi:MAG: citrate synthase [Anaerolineales bacterium]
MARDGLTIHDNRTSKRYELAIENGTFKAMDLRQIKVDKDDFGLMSYDPAFLNTASTKSAITYIDGGRGILRYRGYPIDQLASHSTFLEVAYLILFGELPDRASLDRWADEIRQQYALPEEFGSLMAAFPPNAHPMGMLISAVAALSTFYPEARNVDDSEARLLQIRRLIAQVPTIAACALRHSQGQPTVPPDDQLPLIPNFLRMLFTPPDGEYAHDPTLGRALEVLFILHADHEQNCSTNTMRSIGSSKSDPYSAWAGAAAALYGPLHGGANEAVLKMLKEIGDKKRVPDYVERVKAGEFRLMGFGHRVYKNYDPRARIIKQVADQVFDVTGHNPLLDVALELERIALEDDYFVSRKLYPNVDFYSGIIYQAMGLPVEMYTALFAVARTVGWLAQWQELLTDPEQRIARPRQIYLGPQERTYVPLEERQRS